MADWRDYLGLDDDALLAQCEMDRFRASGPGGQKRNKTSSAVRLTNFIASMKSLNCQVRWMEPAASAHCGNAASLEAISSSESFGGGAGVAGGSSG